MNERPCQSSDRRHRLHPLVRPRCSFGNRAARRQPISRRWEISEQWTLVMAPGSVRETTLPAGSAIAARQRGGERIHQRGCEHKKWRRRVWTIGTARMLDMDHAPANTMCPARAVDNQRGSLRCTNCRPWWHDPSDDVGLGVGRLVHCGYRRLDQIPDRLRCGVGHTPQHRRAVEDQGWRAQPRPAAVGSDPHRAVRTIDV